MALYATDTLDEVLATDGVVVEGGLLTQAVSSSATVTGTAVVLHKLTLAQTGSAASSAEYLHTLRVVSSAAAVSPTVSTHASGAGLSSNASATDVATVSDSYTASGEATLTDVWGMAATAVADSAAAASSTALPSTVASLSLADSANTGAWADIQWHYLHLREVILVGSDSATLGFDHTATSEATAESSTGVGGGNGLAVSGTADASSLVSSSASFHFSITELAVSRDGAAKLGRYMLVMNAVTGALSMYDGIEANAIMQTQDGTVVATPEGLARLDDMVTPVPYSVSFGFTDFNLARESRMENLLVDVRGAQDMSATVSTSGASPATGTYPIELRDTSSPRSTRFVPGRGLYGRYWKVRLHADTGMDFTIFNISADMAESRRRM